MLPRVPRRRAVAPQVVIGSTEARGLAADLGWPWVPADQANRIGPVAEAIVWGPLDRVRAVRRQAPTATVTWRVDGLRLPLADRDRRLVADLAAVVVADEAVRDALLPAVGDTSITIVDPLAGLTSARLPASRTSGSDAVLGVVADGADAPDAVLCLAHVVAGGSERCDACDRRWIVPFLPAQRRFEPRERCRCGSPAQHTPGLEVRIRLAVRNSSATSAAGAVRWLGLDHIIEVVELAGRDWPDVLAWFADVRAVLVMTSSVDRPTAVHLGARLGVPTLVPDGLVGPADPWVRSVPTRTETGPLGHRLLTFDPLSWFDAAAAAVGPEDPCVR